MAAKSPVRRSISGKVAAIERHNPQDPRLGPLRVVGALPAFDQAEIDAAARAASKIDARLARRAGNGTG